MVSQRTVRAVFKSDCRCSSAVLPAHAQCEHICCCQILTGVVAGQHAFGHLQANVLSRTCYLMLSSTKGDRIDQRFVPKTSD